MWNHIKESILPNLFFESSDRNQGLPFPVRHEGQVGGVCTSINGKSQAVIFRFFLSIQIYETASEKVDVLNVNGQYVD